ncbi:hypothetical protein H8S90_02300 [Olivibacter sp. SDN3]|nr:hypothetical protein H8S90_02300 [Olivibacter sp. SDN3]
MNPWKNSVNDGIFPVDLYLPGKPWCKKSPGSAGTSRADSYAIQVILASYPHRSRKSYSGLWVKDR